MEWIKEKNDRYPVTEFRKELSYCTARTAPDIIHKLPVILFTALFRKKEKTAQMQKYNGIVLLEFNHLADVQEIEHIKSLAAEIPQTLAAFTGSGGRSVKILVRFCYPDGQLPLTQEEALIYQAHAYVLAVQVYQPYIPFPIDFKEPLLERGCRFSYDPELYFAPDALPFLLKQPHEMPVDSYIPETTLFQSNPVERMLPGYDKYQIASTLYETSLQEVIDRYGYELPHDRKPFLTRLARNCQRSGVPEEDTLWWTICRFHLYEAETEVRLTFRNTYAIVSGAEEKPCIRQEQLLTIQLEEFIKRRYDFRFNTQTILVEYRKNRSPCFYYRPVNEQVLNSIALDALAEGLKVWDRDVRRHIYSDRIPHYSPLQHFLSQLPRWNQEDHISHLAATVPCSNPLWHRFFFRWFLAMVAQWRRLSTTHGNSLSPLLVGEQGTGKSTFCRKLLPPELRNLYTDRIDFSRKRDAEMALYRFGLINIDEFDQISVRD